MYRTTFTYLAAWRHVLLAESRMSMPAGRHLWAQLLTKLQLTSEQQQKLLTARQCMLSGLSKAGKKRWEIIGRLGLQALEFPGVRILS